MSRDTGVPPVKLYYRIGEVAELVGVEPHVLRYWESEFPTIRPQKSRSGQRVYSRRDVDKLLRVKDLLYAQRFTIAGAKQRLRGSTTDFAPDQSTVPESVVAPEVSCASPAAATTVVVVDPIARATASALRSALLAMREQVLALLEAVERGDS